MIVLKSEKEIEGLRRSNRMVAEVHDEIERRLSAGITTGEIGELAAQFIKDRGGMSAFKGYHGFPGNICVSVNEEVVHGIPGRRKLIEGDIVSLDIGVKFDGYYGDAAVTLPVGKVSPEARRLLEVTERAFYLGIEEARVGKRLFDISHAIQSWVEGNGFSVVRDFVGHGIGARMHEDPQIPNFGQAHQGPRLKAGMVLAIEPMVNAGTHEVIILDDGWTAVTKDGRISAHFEHTIAITEDGPEILSKLPTANYKW